MPSNAGRRVAVIGAGLSGLACAQKLQAAGFHVELFDKGRGLGGRLATRRVSLTDTQLPQPIGLTNESLTGGTLAFDHGAQYFTAKTPAFQTIVDHWISQAVAAVWDVPVMVLSRGQLQPTTDPPRRYVGTPGMSAIAHALAGDLMIHRQTRITACEHSQKQWRLRVVKTNRAGAADDSSAVLFPSTFDALVVTIPAPQARELLRDYDSIVQQILPAQFAPCQAMLLAFNDRFDVPFDAAFVENSPLSWIARNSSKPGRKTAAGDCWVLHASPEWSRLYLEDSPAEICNKLRSAFGEACGRSLPPTRFETAHRWRYALPTDPLPDRSLHDDTLNLGIAGDWCGGPRVEGAVLSGWALAESLLASG